MSDETCRYNTTYDPSDLRDYEFCAGKMEGGSSRCVGWGLKIKSLLTRRGQALQMITLTNFILTVS